MARTEIVSGDAQARFPGTWLAFPVRVIGLDGQGNEIPAAGLSVTWTVVAGGGSVEGAATTTGGGFADGRWRLGPDLGEQAIEASIAGSTAAGFTARAVEPGEIVFVSARQGSPGAAARDLFVMSADGSNVVPLTVGALASSPRWSPDGPEIVYAKQLGGVTQIFVMTVADLAETQLTDFSSTGGPGGAVLDPAWSPDGARIVFSVKQPQAGCDLAAMNIFVMNRSGTDQQRLTEGCGLGQKLADWSPDGSRIVFQQNAEAGGGTMQGERQIMIMNADGSELRPLAGPGRNVARPRWSPDGSKVLFGQAGDLMLVDADGAGREVLWATPATGAFAAWAGGGAALVATRWNDPNGDTAELFLHDIATKGTTRLTESEGWDGEADWRAVP